jgi:hypothetical protein
MHDLDKDTLIKYLFDEQVEVRLTNCVNVQFVIPHLPDSQILSLIKKLEAKAKTIKSPSGIKNKSKKMV